MADNASYTIDLGINDKQATAKLRKLRSELEKLEKQVSSNQALKLNVETNLKKVEKDIQNYKEDIENLKGELDPKAWEDLQMADPQKWTEWYEGLEDAKAYLKETIADLEKTEELRDKLTGQLDKYNEKLDEERSKISQIKDEMKPLLEQTRTAGNAGAAVIKSKAEIPAVVDKKKVAEKQSGLNRSRNSLLSRLRPFRGNAIKDTARGVRQLGAGLGMIFKRLIVFGLVVKGLKEVADWIKKVANTNDETREALGQLKGAWLTLLAPLTQTVIPAITSLAQKLTQIVLQIAQFTSSLFGTSLADAAASAEELYENTKMANGQLAKFDELTVIGDYDNTSFDFAQYNLEEGLFAQRLRDAILGGDWYGAGNILAEKVNEVVANAFDPDALAQKISTWLNRGLEFLAGFFSNLNYGDFGERIGRFIEKMIEGINWGAGGEIAGALAGGLINMFVSAIKQLRPDRIEKALRDFIDGIFRGLDNTLPKEGLFRDIYNAFNDIWKGLKDLWDNTANIRKWFADTGKEIFETIIGALGKIGDWFRKNGEKLGTTLGKLWDGLGPILDGLKERAKGTIDWAVALGLDGLDVILDVISDLVNLLDKLFSGDITGAAESFSELIGDVLNGLLKIFLRTVSGIIKLVFPNSRVAKAIDDFIDGIGNDVHDLGDEVRGAGGAMLSDAEMKSKAIGEKLTSGAAKAVNDIADIIAKPTIPDEMNQTAAFTIENWLKQSWSEAGEISTEDIRQAVKATGLYTVYGEEAVLAIESWLNAGWESNAGQGAAEKTSTGLRNGLAGVVTQIGAPFGQSLGYTIGENCAAALTERMSRYKIPVQLEAVYTNASARQRANIEAYYANQAYYSDPDLTDLYNGYASGTVIPPNHEFLARLGDNKNEPEVVSPLSTMKQAFLEAMSESGGGRTDRLLEELIDVVAGKQLVITPSSSFGRVVAQSEKMYRTVTG